MPGGGGIIVLQLTIAPSAEVEASGAPARRPAVTSTLPGLLESALAIADHLATTAARVALAEARAQKDAEHPLLVAHPEVKASEVVVVTSDRGLCGAFNANVIKFAQGVIAARRNVRVTVVTAGRKAADFFRKRIAGGISADYPQQGWVQYSQAAEIAT